MTVEQFKSDIPLSAGRNANYFTSFNPDRRAIYEQSDYAEILFQDLENLRKYASTEEKKEALAVEFVRYREGCKTKWLNYLSSKSRCASAMITGPANFPTRRNEKANRSADNKYQEYKDFRERASKAIIKKLCPELSPIMAGDSDAVERLTAKIGKAEAVQVLMKLANKIVRSDKSGELTEKKIADLVSLGMTTETVNSVFAPDFCGRVGYPSYKLTNNNANIKRMKGRLRSIQRNQAQPVQNVSGEGGLRLEDCPPDNRVRIFFPGKPDYEVRSGLKSHGFRWTPTLTCWQAYRSQRTLDYAKSVIDGGK